ncbi:MAG: TetR/AcrR family transcriptional regulator [Bacillota bacterium]|nr:TetR/AcrR family transcriptional regulator [Bacillota bacterium]
MDGEDMGKAYSEEEKEEIKIRLRQVGLQLFREKGIKKVSVREVTSMVGIAQGGFYTFYESKEDFMLDLLNLRVEEKLLILEEQFSEALADPTGFVIGILYQSGMHLKENKAFNNIVSDSLRFFMDGREADKQKVLQRYRDFMLKLSKYLTVHGFQVEMDVDGLMNVVSAATILFSNADMLEEKYFEQIYRVFADSQVPLFFRVKQLS